MTTPGTSWAGVTVYALGHSTRPLDELVALLHSFAVVTLADVRTVPRSRRNPQFARDVLARELPAAGVAYHHLPLLGGLRRPRRELGDLNAGWRNESFRGYADHMQGADFAVGLDELRALARAGRTAVMCAEAVPWRCHRSLIADALLARGGVVEQITGIGRAEPHRPTPFARFDGERVTYPLPTDAAR